MAKQLTTAAVQRLRPGKDRREIPDGGCPGLYLIIQPRGVEVVRAALPPAQRQAGESSRSARLPICPVRNWTASRSSAPR